MGFGYRTLVDALLRDAGVSPTVSFESQDLATIEGLVAAGLGVAIVPEPFAGQSGTSGLAIAADGGPPHHRPHLAHRPATAGSGHPFPRLRHRTESLRSSA